jgi:hypothetical protein
MIDFACRSVIEGKHQVEIRDGVVTADSWLAGIVPG